MKASRYWFDAFAAAILLIATCGALHAQVNVTTYHNDNARTGQFTQETILTPANVNSTQFGKLFTTAVDGWVYAQPLYLSNVPIGGGTHNVVYVATEHDSLYAIDADSGVIYWQISLIASGGTTVSSTTDLNCSDIVPEVGITGTPVIDSNTGTIYLVAKSNVGGIIYQYLHAIDVSTAIEKFGAPISIQGSVPGTASDGNGTQLSFSTKNENQRPGLLLENGHVIIGWSSHCDTSPWHGWIMSYSAQSLAQEAVYSTSPNGFFNGVWMSASGVAADAGGNLYFVTGNGSWNGTTDLGDSIVKLGPPSGGSFPTVDYFTPYNQSTLSGHDQDVSSGGLVLLPPLPSGKQLIVQMAKEGKMYVLDSSNMGKYCVNQVPACTASDPQIVQEIPNATPGVWGSPAYWNGSVYWGGGNSYTGVQDSLKAFSFNANNSGLISTTPTSKSVKTFSFSAPIPSISANGNTAGILWGLDNSTYYTGCAANPICQVLYAYDATNLATLLYSSAQAGNNRDAPGGAVKFSTPIIANGKVYVGSQFSMSAYGLFSSMPAAAQPGFTPGSGSFTTTQQVRLSDTTPNSTIYYTTDGSTPNPATSNVYSTSLLLSATTTIKAIATAPGFTSSTVGSATYTLTASTAAAQPTLTPGSTSFTTTQQVSLSDTTPGATIYYTTDGSTPIPGTSSVYSTALLLSATTTVKAIATAAGFTSSTVASATYTLASSSTTTPVSLAAGANVTGFSADGSPVLNGGADGSGEAYSATLLGTSPTWSGITFSLGAPGTLNAISNKTLTLPAGNYSTLYMLGTGLNGNQANQTLVVTYTDGTTSTIIQSFSDWFTPQNYPGESQALTQAYRLISTGGKDSRTFYVYGYTFALNSAKTVASLKLPASRNVVVLAISLQPSGPVTAQPGFTPGSGNFTTTQQVSLSDTTPSSTIYYTTDGSVPIPGTSSVYSTSLLLSATTTVKAIATASGLANSGVASATYTLVAPTPAAQPSFTPGSTSFTTTQQVSLSDTTPGATIYYTTDGSAPIPGTSNVYSTALVLSATTTVKAIATAAGFASSTVGSATYTLTAPSAAAQPGFTPGSTSFTSTQQVSLSDTTPGATIYYTTDGSTPNPATSSVYGSALLLSATTTVKAIATAAGFTSSTVGSATYTLVSSLSTTPVSLASGANVTGFSADGSPVPNGGADGSGEAYSATLLGTSPTWSGVTFTLGAPGTLNAISNKTLTLPAGNYSTIYLLGTGLNGNQPSQTLVVTYTDGTTTTITQSFSDWFTPQTYAGESQALTQSYRLISTGGKDSRTFYVYGYAFPLNSAKTVMSLKLPASRNVVVLAISMQPSGPVTAQPGITPGSGSFTTTQQVSLSDTTPNSTIYYTTDGSVPSPATSSVYSTSLLLSATTTVKAIATASGFANSGLASATYTLVPPTPAAQPGFTPGSGSFTTTQQVGLSDTTPNATIYYTTDGSAPIPGTSNVYSTALVFSATTTVKAIATAAGFASSTVGSATYTLVAPSAAAQPGFTPGSGNFTTTQQVSLSDTTPGATIYYTTDGSAPNPATSSVYGTALVLSATTTVKAIATAPGFTSSAVGSATYTLVSAANVTPVSLASGANVTGFSADGSPVPNGGTDGSGEAYSATLLGTSPIWSGITFTLGAPGTLNAISNKTLTLPAGNYSTLYMLGTGVNGNQASQTLVVTYTDGTTSTITQGFSDWRTPQSYTGESQALTQAYRLIGTGGKDSRTFYVYGYAFALNSGKTVASVKLPASRNVVVLAATLSP